MTAIRRQLRQNFFGAALLVTTVLVTTVLSVVSAAQSGWGKAGDHPEDYDIGVDNGTAFSGTSSGSIKSNKADPKGFGTYMQTFNAENYRGKRLRLSAYVKADHVQNWAALWMRVDRDRKVIAFDNMGDRQIKGSQGWTQHSIVLDVDATATSIAFGLLLSGSGAAWIDDVALDVVGTEVSTTGQFYGGSTPRNLDFDDPPGR